MEEPDRQERDSILVWQSHQESRDARILIQDRRNQDAIGGIVGPPAMGVALGNTEIEQPQVLFRPGLELLDQAARQRTARIQDASVRSQQQQHLLRGLVEM